MNEYVTWEELKATVGIDANFADDDLKLAVSAASRGIDEAAGRRFYADEAAADRYYSPTKPGLLLIDDLFEFTALTVDPSGDGTFPQAWTQNQDFVLEPLNAPADGRPWISIRPRAKGSFTFPCEYERSVKVRGKFGWAAVPDPIKEATTIIASRLLRRSREAPFGVVSLGLEGMAARIARRDPDLCFLLEPFTRGTGG